MKAKQFVLMLLVMLMSVTGAWADTFEAVYNGLVGSFPQNQIDSYISDYVKTRSNGFVKIELTQVTSRYTSLPPIVGKGEEVTESTPVKVTINSIESACVTVTSLDPEKVTLTSVSFGPIADMTLGKYNESRTSWSGNCATITTKITVQYTVKHTHVPTAEWTYDSNQHWHVCSGTGEPCPNNNIVDAANHEYAVNINNDASAYTCSVCGYVNNTIKEQYESRDYLSMTAVGGDVTIGMAKNGTPDGYDLQYSSDKTNWTTLALTATNNNIIKIEAGQTCYFRHGSATATNHISSGDSKYWSFTMNGTGTIEAGGNIMSLLDATCQQTELPMTPQHVFTKLFLGCEKLTVAPRMDAITAVPQWGFVNMFSDTGIKEAPALTATYVRDGAYRGMFENCKELVSVPALPATNLARCAYWDMFKGCDKLASIEIANIENMVKEEGSTGRENSFHDMLAGTAVGTNGVIIAPIEMMGDTRIVLPSNWQWATKLKANQDPSDGKQGDFYTTFYDSRYDYKVEDGFKAYTGNIVTGDDGNELRLTATPGHIIPKGDGVIIHGGSGEVLLTVSEGSAERVDGNVLTGSDTDTTAPSHCYILSYGQLGLGFYKNEEGKALSAHKAFLTYEPFAAQARAMRMVFADGEVDGIETINDGSASSPTGIYSLSGIRLNKLQKGINIVNGKKIIVK